MEFDSADSAADKIISSIKTELEYARKTPSGSHLKTGDIRSLSARLYKEIKNEPIDFVLAVCERLLERRDWVSGVVAFDFAYRMKARYDEKTFEVFEGWLIRYVRGWGDCDDFCTHAFGELICQNTRLAEKTAAWVKRDEFWMRRAAAVVLIPSIKRDKYNETNPLTISDILMSDDHYLVLKGYGWMLKTLSVAEPEIVFDYLIKNKAAMPRVAYRYALEKFDADKRRELMR